MATAVIMPRQGQSVESCIIGKWHKKVGDSVAVGDTLFTYETDKATFDENAKTAGTLLAVFYEEGDDVPVLTNVCAIGEAGESFTELDPRAASAGTGSAPDAKSAGGAVSSETAAATPSDASGTEGERGAEAVDDTAESAAPQESALPQAISPRARAVAERGRADLRGLTGSGPNGRVIERDVRQRIEQGMTLAAGTIPAETGTAAAPASSAVTAAAAGAQTPAATAAEPGAVRVEKHSTIRKVIARTMHASLATMAQLTLHSSFDASDLLDLRSRLKKAGADGLNAAQGFPLAEAVPTINDLILFAAARVLKRHPACNAHYSDEQMTYFESVHLGVAVDTQRGLMVPTVFDADRMPVGELSRQVKELATACQKGTVNPDALKGGTFTVTNLGTLDVEAFTPVINPPQTCILGVCNITTRVREVNGQLSAYPAMGLSLTFDHRAVDGAPAARFLKDLKTTLEHISLLMLQ